MRFALDPRMPRKSLASALTLLTLAACHGSELARGAGNDPARNAPGVSPEDVLPDAPETFRIELSGSACFGTCPTYTAAIDQDGNVSFFGSLCVHRPGAFAHKIAPEDARAVYDALMSTEYRSLGDRYTEEADGCELFTDAPTYSWNVSADGAEKPLVRYAGCEGVDGLEAVDAVMGIFRERSDLPRYLKPSPFECEVSAHAVFSVDLRLSQAGVPQAVLKVANKNGWSGSFQLEDCSGKLLASGELQTDGAQDAGNLLSDRWILLGADRMPVALPGPLGDAGGLLVDLKYKDRFSSAAPSIVGVRALRQDDDVSFDFAVASSCVD